jgi:hypothetical protein
MRDEDFIFFKYSILVCVISFKDCISYQVIVGFTFSIVLPYS